MSKKTKEKRQELTNPEVGLIKAILDKASIKNGVDTNKGTIGNIARATLNHNRIELIESIAGAIVKANAV